MKTNSFVVALATAAVALIAAACSPSADTGNMTAQTATESASGSGMVPTFRVDTEWPRVPDQWRIGEVSSIAIDADDNAWLIHRAYTLPPAEASMAAPRVVGFDPDGNFLRGWGGPGDGYQWPQREHGLSIDHRGIAWLGGNMCPQREEPGLQRVADDQYLKFTLDGEFVTQFGLSDASRGNADTINFHEPADAQVYEPTNEVFIADGYGNHRVIVLDADTGAFKRMWGAFGNDPADKDDCPNIALTSVPAGPGPDQFSIVHALRVSSDGHVYVADRENRRVQVFTLAGDFIDQVIWHDAPFARNVALSADAGQQFLYVGGGPGIRVFDRATLEYLTTIEGDGVIGPGHHIETDSAGNLYIAATGSGHQRLLFTGLAPAE